MMPSNGHMTLHNDRLNTKADEHLARNGKSFLVLPQPEIIVSKYEQPGAIYAIKSLNVFILIYYLNAAIDKII